MKKFFFFILALVTGLSFSTSKLVFAHGGHFHSLHELTEHIENHIKELETGLAQKPLDQKWVNLQCQSILEHGRQYAQAIKKLTPPLSSAELSSLEKMLDLLIHSGYSGDLLQSLNLMRQVKFLLVQRQI